MPPWKMMSSPPPAHPITRTGCLEGLLLVLLRRDDLPSPTTKNGKICDDSTSINMLNDIFGSGMHCCATPARTMSARRLVFPFRSSRNYYAFRLRSSSTNNNSTPSLTGTGVLLLLPIEHMGRTRQRQTCWRKEPWVSVFREETLIGEKTLGGVLERHDVEETVWPKKPLSCLSLSLSLRDEERRGTIETIAPPPSTKSFMGIF